MARQPWPISLLDESQRARPAFDALAVAAAMVEMRERVKIARRAARGAEPDQARADDDLAGKSGGTVGLNPPVHHHRRWLALDAFEAMIDAVLHLAAEAEGIARIRAEIRATPLGLPGAVERLDRRRASADQVSEAQLRFLHVNARRKIFD